MGSFRDLTGEHYGRLTVQRRAPNHKKQTVWECRCSCGNTVQVQAGHLRGGKIISCGCYQKENNRIKATKHGHWGCHLHMVWLSMRQRCKNPKCKSFCDYGGRGIEVCSAWDSYSAFEQWALAEGYKQGLSIERKNVNGNYCPENCTWIPLAEQMKNTRRTLNNRVPLKA